MGKKLLARGVPARSRTENYHRKGLWAIKRRGPAPNQKKKAPTGRPRVVKTVPFGKGTRTVVRPRAPRVYLTDPIRHKLHHRKSKDPVKVRKSLVPGTVLIVLSGKARGRRVVLLKVLESGLLLVTGPYKANGVPLRRINPAYVIATSTKVDVSALELPKELDDKFFKKPRSKKTKRGYADFLGKKKEGDKKATKTKSTKAAKQLKKNKISEQRVALQKQVDEQLIPIIKKEDYLFDYLASLFTLQQGQYPHLIKF